MVDAIYIPVRQDEIAFPCWLIIVVTEHGRKEFVTVENAYRES
ncbi:MAG: hypothetical protein ACTS73_07385 [Arsenophonus sp. NEOnobi-MAG3]